MSILDGLIFGVRKIFSNGTELPTRSEMNFIGGTCVDNPTTKRIDVSLGGGGGSGGAPSVADGRLTASFNQAYPSDDIVGASTLYYLPYVGGYIGLWNGSSWDIVDFTTVTPTLTLSGLANNTNYDVFIYNNGGTPTLELSAAWSGNASNDIIGRLNGIAVKTADPTRRCIGTIRTTSTTTVEDSRSKRYVWNLNNQVPRPLAVIDSTDSWNYTAAAWRQSNANTANAFDFVWGGASTGIRLEATAYGFATTTASQGAFVASGIGVGATNANSAKIFGGTMTTFGYQLIASYRDHWKFPGHTSVAWLEYGASNAVFYGDAGAPTSFQMGMVGEIFG